MTTKKIVKKGNKIIGFVHKNLKEEYFYSFGKPSQNEYLSFKCNNLQHGIKKINEHSKI